MKSFEINLAKQFALVIILSDNFLKGVKTWSPGLKNTFKEPSQKDGYFAAGKQLSEIADKLELMESKIDILETGLERNAAILKNLQDAAKADENYWNSTDSCGGVIVAQTGRIQEADNVISKQCIWTICANHRSQIQLKLDYSDKIQSRYYYETYWSNCQVVELKFGDSGPGGSQSLEITKISFKKSYLFRGPIIFVSCFVDVHATSSFLTFKGIGPLIYRNVVFTNLYLHSSNGSLESVMVNSDSKSTTLEYTTLIINPYPGPSKLSVTKDNDSAQNNQCNENLPLYLYQNFTNSLSPVYNCCKINCLNKKFLVAGDFFLATLSGTPPSPHDPSYKLSWQSVQHSSLTTTCGGIISHQTNGYVEQAISQNNQRCLWVIHTFPKTAIQINMQGLSFVDGNHDYLVAVEIDREEPVTTRLSGYNTYNLTGRVIIIMLYTDNTITGGTVSFRWKAIGPIEFATLSDDSKLFRSTLQYGQEVFNSRLWSPITNMGFHTFVINPQEAGPHLLNLTINNATLEGKAKLRILGSRNSNFTNLLVSENNIFEDISFQSWDGVFIVILEIQEASSNGTLDISWKPGESILPPQFSSCGGVVNAATGSINYYPGLNYPYSDRCIWILHCPYESITLTLRKQDDDQLLVDLVDYEGGTILPNQTSIFSSENQTQTFNGPLLILTFNSKNWNGNGFLLDFTGNGSSIDRSHRFRLIHRNERDQTFVYPFLDESPLKSGEILILAYSNVQEAEYDDYNRRIAISTQISSNMTLHFNIETKLEERKYDTDLDRIDIYSHKNYGGLQPDVKCSISSGPLEDQCEFNVPYEIQKIMNPYNTTKNISIGIQFDFTVIRSAFLLTYQPAPSEVKALAFNLTWKDDDGSCGGIRIGESGYIEYKLYKLYNNNEHCIWIIESPGKQSLSISMISVGANDCDQVTVTSINPKDGTLGSSTELSTYRSTVVQSSAAIITFYSDSTTRGTGFKLSFTGLTDTAYSNDKFLFRHIQEREYETGNDVLSVPSISQEPMNINEIIMFSFSPSNVDDGGIDGQTSILLRNLTMFVNDNCTTDSLRFYAFSPGTRSSYGYGNSFCYTNSYYMYKSYRSYANSSFCNKNETESNLPDQSNYYDYGREEIIPTCETECYNVDVLSGLSLSDQSFTIKTPFIAIYKSVTEQTSDQTPMTFEWKRTS